MRIFSLDGNSCFCHFSPPLFPPEYRQQRQETDAIPFLADILLNPEDRQTVQTGFSFS